ncbi:DNA-processing protein DprA [Sporosarcina jiandibaonis]|uniref:DNA-processing protein DprA n=1 Tax=Sporosarcina jiandibaonis TaxID=2715535 RepID=UPI001555F201|nr:DNA-processing protein DprA [Sporosarcina jiandibaonis]
MRLKFTDGEKRLLALHYLFPVPKNRLNALFEIDPNLEKLHTYPAERLAFLLHIKMEKAVYLKESFLKNLSTPYDLIYKQHRITPIPFTHSLYPKRLLELIDPPTILYTKGDISILAEKFKVAIIGSRKATVYSKNVMSLIVPPLVANNAVVVSGLAKGADAMAHKAAIFYGGKTIAVLGHGLFHLYPYENRELANEISKNHLLISEYPSYVKPVRWTFPMRNRIISGLSDAVIVTESASKSGTMSTVEHALDHGKHIFAVPGSVMSSLSEGPNKLIDEGAQPLWNGFQVVGSLLEQT